MSAPASPGGEAKNYTYVPIVSEKQSHESKWTRTTGVKQHIHHSRGTRIWNTILCIVGCLIGASVCAIGHFCLFKGLDGKLVDQGMFKQSQLTALSILFTTLFKTALAVSAAACFTQQLWYHLRGAPLSIFTIERMFTMRTNLFALGDPRMLLRAPLLVLMALFIWCLGIATIFPPGALTVEMKIYDVPEHMNISVMNPSLPKDFNPMDADENVRYPLLSTGPRPDPQDRSYTYWGPSIALQNIAKSIVNNSPLFQIPSSGEGSRYLLKFRAPQLNCTMHNTTVTVPLSVDDDGYLTVNDIRRLDTSGFMDLPTPPGVGDYSVSQPPWWLTNFTYRHDRVSEIFSPRQWQLNSSAESYTGPRNLMAKTERLDLVCYPKSVRYNLSVKYPKGRQMTTYTLNDPKPLEPAYYLAMPDDGKQDDAKRFIDNVTTTLPRFNEFAILDALVDLIDPNNTIQDVSMLSECTHKAKFDNGTVAYRCDIDQQTFYSGFSSTTNTLMGTIFDINRFNTSTDLEDYLTTIPSYLDVREAVLNEALTNITISAISLGTWWETVLVNTTQARNTYKFSNPLHLILPYSITLAIGICFAGIALHSLWSNGISAADNGFTQVMLATRGNTKMGQMALNERCTAAEDMSQDLRALKIRYGELVGQGGVVGERRLGFGTVDETVSLRRRN